eukprot:3561733-Heterocapsa_arctica.AAC.1
MGLWYSAGKLSRISFERERFERQERGYPHTTGGNILCGLLCENGEEKRNHISEGRRNMTG